MGLAGLMAVAHLGCLVSPDPSLWQQVDAAVDLAAADLTRDTGPDADAAVDVSPDSPPIGVATIYRSVGPGSTQALAQGQVLSSAVAISGVVAAFDKPLPDRVGVGDVLLYDADGDGDIDGKDAVGFVHRRYSASSLELRGAAGQVPRAASKTTVWSLWRAYTSLADAVSCTENSGIVAALRDFDTGTGGRDLVAANRRWELACYADATETSSVTITGWTTSTDNPLRIFAPWLADQVGTPQRHMGHAGAGFVITPAGPGHAVQVQVDHVQIDGLEIAGWQNDVEGASYEGVHLAADDTVLQDLLIHDDLHPGVTNPNGDGINLNEMKAGQSVTIRNCMIYGISRGAINYQDALALSITIQSCTIHDTGTTLANADDEGGINIASTTAAVEVTNTISVGSASGDDFKSGSGWSGSSNNISSDASAPGGSSITAVSASTLFVSLTSGSEDLHLVAGCAAVDAGASLSGSFSTDIDAELRTAPWDIGADER